MPLFDLFKSAPAGISVSDPGTGRLLEVNEEFTRIFGYTHDEAVGRTTSELGLWNDLADRDRLLEEIRTAGALRDVELRMRGHNGDLLVLRAAFYLLRTNGAERVVAVFTDRTTSSRSEEALRLSEQRFATIFRESPVALAVSEFETGRFVDVNLALLRMMRGTSFDQMVGRTSVEIGMISAADRRNEIVAQLRRAPRAEGILVPMHRLDGEPFSAELALSSYVADGKRFLLTSIVDVTQRIRSEDDLRHAEQQYRELVEGVRDVVFSMTPKGILTSLNPAFERITGLPAADWIGRSFVALLHPDDVARAGDEYREALAGRHDSSPPLRFRTATAEYRLLDVEVTAHMEGDCLASVMGIARDVSERVLLENEFRHAQKMEAVGHLAGGIAHDFNNLLTVILGCGSLALETLAADAPSRQDVQEIVAAAQRAADLTRQLLAFSRRQLLEPKTLDLNEVVAGIEKMLRRLLGEHIALITNPGLRLNAVQADPGQLEQVIANLVVNARDAMPSGGSLTMSTRNVTTDEAFVHKHPGTSKGRWVRLTVTDTGTGMTPEAKSRLFEPFFTTKEPGKGTGLGLATTYGIIAQSRGFIVVNSELGRGSSFEIYLPALATPVRPERDRASIATPLGGRETVLLVEDNQPLRNLVEQILNTSGYRVLTADNGASALVVFRDHAAPIDLLLTDLVMPELGGRALADHLLRDQPSLKIIYMTGYVDDAADLRGLQEHSALLLRKPFSPPALLQKVRELLDR